MRVTDDGMFLPRATRAGEGGWGATAVASDISVNMLIVFTRFPVADPAPLCGTRVVPKANDNAKERKMASCNEWKHACDPSIMREIHGDK